MPKKVLFMLCTWQEPYSKAILSGIEKAIENIDIEIHAINAYDIGPDYFAKEVEAFKLADVRNYDGVMMLFNAIGTESYLSYYSQECKRYGIPAISIDVPSEGIGYCRIDNYHSAFSITEHLIKEHNVTKLQFVGGPETHSDSVERGKAFCDCLKKYNLEPYGFGYYGFISSSGSQAYNDVKHSGKPMAEAYVFANDYSALGFCAAAKEDGLEPPRDFLVTGFDNQEEAKNYYPSLSTIDRNLEEIGSSSILHLLDIIDGKEAPDSNKSVLGIVVRGGSCGCEKCRDLPSQYLELNSVIARRNINDILQKGARESLCGNDSFEQYQYELRKFIEQYGLVDFIIGINHSITDSECTKTDGYDEIIDVYGAYTYAQIRRDTDLIPMDFRDKTSKIYVFGALHCKARTLGYSIFKYEPKLMDFQYLRTLNETASLAVENIRQTQILNRVNQKLESLYIRDSLTGLYNRFGYNALAGGLYSETNGRVYVVFIDMDNLKLLNDNYGHDYGDLAIKGIALAMKEIFTDTDIKVRMGGDEFLVLGPYVSEDSLNEKESEMKKYLKEYAEKENLPINLEVSMGYSFHDENTSGAATGLEKLIQLADSRMYENKQERKKHGTPCNAN